MFFCPVRPADFTYAQTWYMGIYHKPLMNMVSLNIFFTSDQSVTVGGVTYYGRSENGGYGKLYHDWFVPRLNSSPNGFLFPTLTTANATLPAYAVGWPAKTSDRVGGISPIITDYAEGNGTPNLSTVPSNEAHFYHNVLDSVNVCFGDGRVELHNSAMIQWQYTGNGGQQSYFY
jgi:hypothetical protein